MGWGVVFFSYFISLHFAASRQFGSNKASSNVTGSADEVWGTPAGDASWWALTDVLCHHPPASCCPHTLTQHLLHSYLEALLRRWRPSLAERAWLSHLTSSSRAWTRGRWVRHSRGGRPWRVAPETSVVKTVMT